MHVVRQLNLARQRGGQRNQHARVQPVLAGHPGQIAEHHDQRKDAADGRNALTRQDGANLRAQGIAQPQLEAAVPQPVVVAVTGGDVVPRGVGVANHPVGGALLCQVGGRHRPAHQPLQPQQKEEDAGVHHGQAGVDGKAQYDGIKDQPEKQFEVGLQLVNQFKKNVKNLIGQKRLHVVALGFVGQQGRLMAVVPRKAQHVAAKCTKPGTLGENPAGGTHQVGG